MKIADFGDKEIHTRIANNSSLYEMYLTGGGVMPKPLQGLYSTVRDATLDLTKWQAQNRARMEKNVAKTRASKKANAKAS